MKKKKKNWCWIKNMYFKHDISDICRKKKSHKTATSKKDGNKYTFEYVNKKITASKNNISILQ